jgi:hypothetical protein
LIWEIVILALGIPAGYLLAWLGRDELVSGRKWFRVLIIVGILSGIWLFLVGERSGAWTSGFAVVVGLVSLVKSEDKKWTKQKI